MYIAGLSSLTAGDSPAVVAPRPYAVTPTTPTPQLQPWRRSVLPQNPADSVGVDALARRFGRFDVTHITGNVLPQVETTLVVSR